MKSRTVLMVTLTLSLLAGIGEGHSPHDNVNAIAVSPAFAQDGTIFCSLTHINTYILKSADGGLSWEPSQIGFPNCAVSCLEISPSYARDGTVFAGTDQGRIGATCGGIFKSTDRGVTWTAVNSGLTDLCVQCLALSPTFQADGIVLAGTRDSGVFGSKDGGATWVPLSTGLLDTNVQSLAMSPSYLSDLTVYAGTMGGVFKSLDGGKSWFDPSGGSHSHKITSVALSPAYSKDRTVFFGSWEKGVFKSVDEGANWSPRNLGLTELAVTHIEISPEYASDDVLLAATREKGVYRSNNGGDSWVLVDEGLFPIASYQSQIHYFDIAFSPDFGQDGLVFLASFEGVHRARAGTPRWVHLDVYNQNLIRTMSMSPAFETDGTVFAGSYAAGIYRTETRGDSWIPVDTGLQSMKVASVAVSPDYAADSTVFSGYFSDLARSTVKGNAWAGLSVNPSDWIYIRSIACSPDYATDRTLLAGNGREGSFKIFRSTDGGASFASIKAGFLAAHSLAFSPDFLVDQTAFAGTDAGVFRSVDGGITWAQVLRTRGAVLSVAVSPGFLSDRTVFAATLEHGVARSRDGGNSWDPVNTGLSDPVVEVVGLSPDFSTDGTLFAATKSRGLFISRNRGATWDYVGLEGTFLRSMAISPGYSVDGTMLLGVWDGILRTEDFGQTWSPVLKIRRCDNLNSFVSFTQGCWKHYTCAFASGPGVGYSDTVNAEVRLNFVAESVSLIGERTPYGGIARIFVDGVPRADVDCYSPKRRWQEVLFTMSGLGPYVHNITIEVTGTSNPQSQGTFVFVDAFDLRF